MERWLFAILLLGWMMSGIGCLARLVAAEPVKSPDTAPLHDVLADYDAELRGPDGRVDIKAMVGRLKELGVNTYVLDSIHSWSREALSQIELSDFNCFLGYSKFWIQWKATGKLTAWRKVTGFEQNSFEADPRFVDARVGDFHLQAGSPCIDKGRPITHAVGNGKDTDTITVAAAYSFTDGNGLIDGDTIQIGRGQEAQFAEVVEVVDETHLRLDRRVSWRDGAWVSFPFQGEAPDIGAYEFGDDRRIIGPTWKHYPHRTLPHRF